MALMGKTSPKAETLAKKYLADLKDLANPVLRGIFPGDRWM